MKIHFAAYECQMKVLFVFWWFWILIHVQMLFLNTRYVGMKVVLVLMKQIWTQIKVLVAELI